MDDADILVMFRLEIARWQLQAVGHQPRVRIEEQEVFGVRASGALIAGRRETSVTVVEHNSGRKSNAVDAFE